MFLLIPWADYRYKTSVVTFTFQYVSINTGTAVREEYKLSVFTFQYVSINTKCVLAYRTVCSLFTFQYVSINTREQ